MNRYKSHLLVLPEDDANRQIANGFLLDPNLNARAIQVLPPAGGWQKAVSDFQNIYVPELQRYTESRLVLLIDFDLQPQDRLNAIKSAIPQNLQNRVFVLGSYSEPEALKTQTAMTFEEIGKTLSQDCVDGTRKLWGHDLLKHNDSELDRLFPSVKPFLFDTL